MVKGVSHGLATTPIRRLWWQGNIVTISLSADHEAGVATAHGRDSYRAERARQAARSQVAHIAAA
jgi:hypothetical protein